MDKLKPILAQKFWILAGLCLILPLTGWWMATAGLAREIEDRTNTIEAAFGGIPQPGPNDNWTNRVKTFNVEEERKVKETGDFLWTNQLQYMTWPEKVREGVERAGYDGDIDAKTRTDYRYEYDKEIKDTLSIVSPYNPEDSSGLVDASIELIPNAGWGTSQIPPNSKEMRDSQEDLWLYRALLQAVAKVNNNDSTESTSIVDSKIKQISVLELRGGTAGGAKAAGTTPGGAMPGGPAAMPPGGPAMPPGGLGNPMMNQSGGRGLDGMGTAGGAGALGASFDPAEQFGPDDDTSAATGGTPSSATPPGAPAGPGVAAAAMPPSGPGKMGLGMAGGASNVPRKRYIEETPRYKTRGFYMEVVMDHRNVPEFVSELSDSGWPLRVIRIQAVDRDLSDIDSGVVGAGAGGMTSGGVMKGMTSMGAMRGTMPSRPPGRGIADREDMDSRPPGRMVRPPSQPGIGGETSSGAFGEGGVSVDAAMADPYLVNVALSGIITLYLPPAPVGGTSPVTPGSAATSPATTATPAAAPAATTTSTTASTPATTTDAAGATSAEAPAEKPAAAAEEAKPTGSEADPAKPAAEPAKPASEVPATPPAANPPAPGTSPAPAAVPAEKPAGTK